MPKMFSLPGLRIGSIEEFEPDRASCDEACVLIADQSISARDNLKQRLPGHVVLVAADAAAEGVLGDAAELSLAYISDDRARLKILRTAFHLSAARRSEAGLLKQAAAYRREVAELNRIGMALMREHNRDELLRQILTQVMRSTGSDGGAMFMIDTDKDGTAGIYFKLVRIDSLSTPFLYPNQVFPIDSTSVTGHAARTRQPIIVDDIHNLPPDSPFSVTTFAEDRGYFIKSMIAIPMLNHRDEVVGVMQLANRKRAPNLRIVTREDAERHTIPYGERDMQFGLSLAGQAAILIENARLYAQIDEIFACFVKAAVTAIDQRDPATAGHSVRVATLVTDLAAALERSAHGSSRNLRFSNAQIRELRYAALLHDFGKVGVREAVLVKANKLPPALNERLDARYELIHSALLLAYERKRAQLLCAEVTDPHASAALEAEFTQEMVALEQFKMLVQVANQPAVLHKTAERQLSDVARRTFQRPDGRVSPYLEPEELHYLHIPYGSLDAEERTEIEAHAARTYEFLSHIPWTEDLKHLPDYASSHHEKLDGSGYPLHLRGTAVPVQTRILAVADIFDALTAADRPYRPAVSPERALDIIESEVLAGRLDAEVSAVMISSGVYRRILQEDWHNF
jgi:HD-GYP domain-containing protein (c-di-GMP phosphodiesterase class II)